MISEFNPLFQRFVDESGDQLRGMVAYGIYKTAKREWIRDFQATHERTPTNDEVKAYSATWTTQLVTNAEDAADSVLAEYAAEAIADARPAIIQETLRGSRLTAILLSMLANLLYTILLVAFVVVLKVFGIDVIAALQAIPVRR